MKINYLGIVASIIAFVSLALPWWTMPISGTYMGIKMSGDMSVYTHDARVTMEAMGFKATESIVDGFSIWYGYAALVLIVIAGVAGIVGSLIAGKNGKMILLVAGTLALVSIIIFAVGLDHELVSPAEATGGPEFTVVSASGSFGLFSSGSISVDVAGTGLMEFDYSTYLTFGFWLAVIATILTFVSLQTHPKVAAPPPSPPPAVSPEPVQAPLPSPPAPAPAPTKPPKMHCVYCGAENPPHADFCLKCGKKMVKP